jgi:alkanesulfonate monooxygenase SsuD/methylene tetrahydromethanopterin reductase-like flavin-dependent oxidoreductase (luciferase family)
VPNSAHFVGKYGDGLVTVGSEEPETYREILENFEAGARHAGKDPTLMPRMVELAVAYTDDEASAIEYRKNIVPERSSRPYLPNGSKRRRWPKKMARPLGRRSSKKPCVSRLIQRIISNWPNAISIWASIT